MRQEFTANVSHELKTPLTTIKGFGEMFGSGMITKEEDVAKYGAMIERESERLLFLINDIIRLSEIEEHTEMLNTPVALEAAAKNALQILEPADSAEQNSRPAGRRLSAAPQQRGLHTGIVHQPH